MESIELVASIDSLNGSFVENEKARQNLGKIRYFIIQNGKYSVGSPRRLFEGGASVALEFS